MGEIDPAPEEYLDAAAEAYLVYLRARRDLLAADPGSEPSLRRRLRVVSLLHGHGTEAPAPTDPAAPLKRLGRYELRGELGRGATATVYRAYDLHYNREVALKVFNASGPGDDTARERLERDARIAARLRHPHIVPFHEAGKQDGLRYLDMQLIDGPTLEARLTDKPLSFRDAAALVRKLADALDYAHGQGIIHRDVKPSNILLDEEGEPQLTDFGLARWLSGETLTAAGSVFGTPHYMPPEQAKDSHAADARSDVYALGAVLYRLLTGRVLFPGAATTEAQIYAILHTDPPAPRAVNPAIPRDLETVCLKALAKEPADRYPTAAALGEDLRRWLDGEPLLGKRRTLWAKAARWARRNKVLSAAAALVLVAGGFILWQQDRRRVESRALAEVEVRRLLLSARERMQQPTQGRRLETQQILLQIKEPLRRITDNALREELLLDARSLYAATLALPDLQINDSVELPYHFAYVWQTALHPDGSEMAVSTPEGPVRWGRGQVPPKFDHLDPTKERPRLAYNLDGTLLAFAPRTGGLELYADQFRRRITLEPRPEKPSPSSAHLAFGFSPDGKSIWTFRADGAVCSWSLPDGRPLTSWWLDLCSEGWTTAAFDATVARLLVGDKDGSLGLYHINGERLAHWIMTNPTEITALAFPSTNPQHDWVAVGTKSGAVQLWTHNGSLMQDFQPAFHVEVNALAYTSDGRWLFAGDRHRTRVWDVMTGELLLEAQGALGGRPRDERLLALGGTQYARYGELVRPDVLRTLTGHHVGIARLAWSADSRFLASLDLAYTVRVWDVTTGQAVRTLSMRRGDFFATNAAIALNGDGSRLAYANGGEAGAVFVLYDTATGREILKEKLPPGFETLGYSEGRFVLVREELDKEAQQTRTERDNWPVRTMVYECPENGPLGKPRVLRPCGPDDDRRMLHCRLSPDGKYYVWCGPRRPAQKRRVEVYEVATGKILFNQDCPSNDKNEKNEVSGFLSHDGRALWVNFKRETRRYDLVLRTGGEPVERWTPVSPDNRWSAYTINHPTGAHALCVGPGDAARCYYYFRFDNDFFPQPQFSPDSRLLVWDDAHGKLTVADLAALHERVTAFAKELGGE